MLGLNGFIGGDVDAPITEQELEGLIEEIGALPRSNASRKKAVSRMATKVNSTKTGTAVATSTSNSTAKVEFEKRLHLIDPAITEALKSQRMQIVDKNIYTAKKIGTATNAELMLNSDVAVAGVANINNRKLEANQSFLVTGIILLSCANADEKAGTYDTIPANIQNGDFQLMVGSKVLIPKISCQVFATGRNDLPKGYHRLENPKMIPPQTEIKPEIFCPAPNAENTCVKVILLGATVEKN
ncbi:MAG: hypothetical protein GX587_02525 [Bacteroidales bacterium]|nr:hypothetical protein [Bacteroidales bacterium]